MTGNEKAAAKIFEAQDHTLECLTSFINVTELNKEIEEAAPRGNLETVFNKYCKRRNEVVECVENYAMSYNPCFTNEEIKHKDSVIRVVKKLVEFVCHKDGDQIARKFSFVTVGFTSHSLIQFIFSLFIGEWARLYTKS